MPVKILLIEDDRKTAAFIKKGLEEENYAVDVAADGEKGESLAEGTLYDTVIIDRLLPKKDGMTICRNLKARPMCPPILILSALDSVTNKIEGLEGGADDYLGKPFSFDELLARIKALQRRSRTQLGSIIKIADLELDPVTHRVMRAGKPIALSNREYALLEYLLRNRGKVMTRNSISQHVWGRNFDARSNVIDVHINFVRNKIDRGYKMRLIHTIRGAGYVLRE